MSQTTRENTKKGNGSHETHAKEKRERSEHEVHEGGGNWSEPARYVSWFALPILSEDSAIE